MRCSCERRQHLLVAVRAGRRVDVDGRVAQVGLDVDAHHGDEIEPLVVDALDLLGDDLMQQLVEPRRARVAASGPGAVARSSSVSIQSDRSPPTTSTSGKDHTNRSTSSSTSRTCDSAPDDARDAELARCHWS